MTRRAAGATSLAGAAVVAVGLPLSTLAHGLAVATATLIGLAWLVSGLRRHRPGGSGWSILAASALLTAVATLIRYAPVFAGGDKPLASPSLPDGLRVVGLFLLAAGLVVALTRRERPLMILLDIASIVIGTALVIGVVVVEPALARTAVPLDLRITQVAYVACDVALIAGVARVLLAPRGRSPALWLVASAATGVVASSLVRNPLMLAGDSVPGAWAAVGAVACPLLLGLAALHPSMRRLSAVERRTDGELRATGALVLGLTSLIAPLLLGAHAFVGALPDIDGSRGDSIALLVCSLLLGTLVVGRFMLLIRRARRLASRSEKRYQQLVEQVPAVVVLFVLRPGVSAPLPVYVSPQAEAIVGLRPEDWLANPLEFTARIDRGDLTLLTAELAEQLAGSPGTQPEFRITRPDGEEIWLRDVSGVVTEDDDGRYLHAMFVDITDAKRAEADREQMEGELRVSQKLEAVGQLAAGIAHEINTPVQFVGDTMRFLQDAFDDLLELTAAQEHLRQAVEAGGGVDPAVLARVHAAEHVADLEYLRERVPGAFQRGADGVSRIAAIVRAMRDFAHPPTLEKAPVDVVATLRDTLIVAMNTYKYVAEVTTDFEELPSVMANGGELNQVFLNLVVNAAHAIETVVGQSGGRGAITLSTRRDGEHVRISIGDTGCGIPDDVAARVFDPFFTTKEVGRGTGQGLALARTMVVERHGGTLTFDTEPGRGTTFHVKLPIGEAA
jgi:PAS domain S-box-containing protein